MKPAFDGLPTTDLETAFWAYDAASVSNLVVVVHFRGKDLPFPLLRDQLESSIQRHPYFRHTFSADGRWLIPAGRASAAWSVRSVEGPLSWVAEAEAALHEPFDMTALPLVRAQVLLGRSESVFLLSLPHLIADGKGALNWVWSIFRQPRPALDFLRPSSDHFDPRRSQSPPMPEGVRGANVHGDPATRSLLLPVVFSEVATARFLQQAANFDLSWNSLLVAAAVLALWAGDSRFAWVKVTTAVDLRDSVAVDGLTEEHLGLWAGRYSLYLPVDGESTLSNLAHAYYSLSLAALRRSVFTGSLELVKGRQSLQPPSFGVIPHVKVTNLGDLDQKDLNDASVPSGLDHFQVYTALHRGMQGPWGLGIVTSLFQKRLNLGLCFGIPGAETAFRTQVTDRLATLLGAAAEEVTILE